METIAVANHKGGVGKTATTHALGTVLAEDFNWRVLLVDIDPQSSLTGASGIGGVAGKSLAEVLGGAAQGSLILGKIIKDLEDRLYLVPADLALATAELGLVSRMGRENVLKKALDTVETDYDVVIIDCPPSLGLLTLNGLTAADVVLIPTQPQVVDLRGLRLFLDTLDQIRVELNPKLETMGILLTFYDHRLIHHRDARGAMERSGLPLMRTQIGRSVRVAEAAANGETVVTYAPRNPQATAYRELSEEVDKWLRNKASR